MNEGPIFIVDDDRDDQAIVEEVWKELGYPNKLHFFHNAEEALQYIKTDPVEPFLIICDVNAPKMGGFELKKRMLESDTLFYKSIPFVFWSTQASKEQIKQAYKLKVNGFFMKEDRFEAIKSSLRIIVEYWSKSVVPE